MLLVESFQNYVDMNTDAKVSWLQIFIFPDKFFKVSSSSEVVCKNTVVFSQMYVFVHRVQEKYIKLHFSDNHTNNIKSSCIFIQLQQYGKVLHSASSLQASFVYSWPVLPLPDVFLLNQFILQQFFFRNISKPSELTASSVIRCRTGVTEPPIKMRTYDHNRKVSVAARSL